MVTNTRPQLRTISQNLSKLLRVFCHLAFHHHYDGGRVSLPFTPSESEAQFSDEENQGLPRDPTDHSFECISAPKSELAICQCHLIEASHKPVRSMPLFSPFDR